MQITGFASLKNDADYDSDNQNIMPMQGEDDVGILHEHNFDDESNYDILNDVSSTSSDDEEEKVQYDFDDWFIEQNQKNPLVKKIILFNFWTTLPAIV